MTEIKRILSEVPSLSIVITTYNSASYIEQLLCSLSRLVLPRKYEIIFVDDCSSDDTVKKIKDYIQNKNRFSLIRSEENQGPAGTRNKGIKKASFDYIFFWDCDDKLDNNIFVKMLACARENPCCDVIVCDTCWESDDGRNQRDGKYIYQTSRLFSPEELLVAMNQRFNSLNKKGILDIKGKLVKLAYLKSKDICFDEELRYLEDEVFLWHLFSQCRQAAYLCEQLYIYRINESSRTGVIDGLLKEFNINSLLRIAEQANQAFKSFGCSSSCGLVMSERVLVYFIVNVLVSSAKSALQGKVSVEECNAFIASLFGGISSSKDARWALKSYSRCEGESLFMLIALRSRVLFLVKWAAFRRARKILG